MIYCSLEDAWGKESIKGQLEKYNYKESIDNKKKTNNNYQKIEKFDNTSKKKKTNNVWQNNQKKYEKKSCDSYTLEDVNEIYSDEPISTIEDSEELSDIDSSVIQPKETSFYKKKKNNTDDLEKKKID